MVVILIIAVVIAIICSWAKKQMSTVSERLLVLEREIEIQLHALNVAKALKTSLDKKVKVLLTAMKLAFCLTISILWIALFASNQNLMSSIFDAFDLVGILYISISFLLLNRCTEPNKILSTIRKQVQVWVYQSSSFETHRIAEIEYQINLKRRQAEEIRNRLTIG